LKQNILASGGQCAGLVFNRAKAHAPSLFGMGQP